MSYSLPLTSNNKKKTFMVSSNFQVDNGKIKASNIGIDNAYGNLPIDKVANLINLINPLSFTLAQINDSDCKGQVENIKIDDSYCAQMAKCESTALYIQRFFFSL